VRVRSFSFIGVVVALLAPFFGANRAAPPAKTFTVAKAQTAFKAETGLELVHFRAASTPEVTSLRTKPARTTRFGDFQLFVLHPSSVKRMKRVFTNGVAPNPQGIHWVPDRAGGWIAVTVFERNLVLAWFPRYGSQELDDRWYRLQGAVAELAPRAKRKLVA
jgi:hypothetical protein